MRTSRALGTAVFVLTSAFGAPALAQYNHAAGRSAPTVVAAAPVADAAGHVTYHMAEVHPQADRYGNAQGNQFDLAVDGAFEGQTVAVLQLYTGEGFDFSLPRAALRQKGFSVYRWSNAPPSPADFRAALARASQLWVISGPTAQLNTEHLDAIRAFFDAGHGVYIWGDNSPYYADANAVARRLFDASMDGNLPGAHVVGLRGPNDTSGLLRDHLITTGLEHLYEGVTIATIHPTTSLTPLLYGSEGNLVSAFYDHDGRRAIIDGGFTRLYVNWDTAGTARYVKNAAAWLANAERFGTTATPHVLPTAPATPATPAAPHATTPAASESHATTPRASETAGRASTSASASTPHARHGRATVLGVMAGLVGLAAVFGRGRRRPR